MITPRKNAQLRSPTSQDNVFFTVYFHKRAPVVFIKHMYDIDFLIHFSLQGF